MPNFLRLVIMLGEIIGFVIISFVLVCKYDKKRKEYKRNTEQLINDAKKKDIIFFVSSGIIILLIFIFGFRQMIFLSYYKMISIFITTIISIIFYWGTCKANGVLFKEYRSSKEALTDVNRGSKVLFLSPLLAAVVLISFFGVDHSIFKTYIEQKEEIEIIYPEFIGDKKIAHINGTNKYIFSIIDDEGELSIKEDIEFKYKDIESCKDNTYIEKHVVTKTFCDREMDALSDDYIGTESEVTYVLFLNEEQLFEIKTD